MAENSTLAPQSSTFFTHPSTSSPLLHAAQTRGRAALATSSICMRACMANTIATSPRFFACCDPRPRPRAPTHACHGACIDNAWPVGRTSTHDSMRGWGGKLALSALSLINRQPTKYLPKVLVSWCWLPLDQAINKITSTSLGPVCLYMAPALATPFARAWPAPRTRPEPPHCTGSVCLSCPMLCPCMHMQLLSS